MVSYVFLQKYSGLPTTKIVFWTSSFSPEQLLFSTVHLSFAFSFSSSLLIQFI